MTTVWTYAAVALGGAIGAVLRMVVSAAVGTRPTTLMPVSGTVVVNVVGCLLIGLAMAALPRDATTLQRLLVTGVLGSFTTFSTFSYETVQLLQSRAYLHAAANAVGSVVIGLAMVALGLWLGSRLRTG